MPGGRPTCGAWTRRGGTCECGGRNGGRERREGGCGGGARPAARPSLNLAPFFFPPHPHSKDAWAAPTKGVGSWTSDTATARFEARHDAALKALRRPRIDE